jgi:hypothetical protein
MAFPLLRLWGARVAAAARSAALCSAARPAPCSAAAAARAPPLCARGAHGAARAEPPPASGAPRAEASLGEHGLLAGVPADGAFYSQRLPDLRAAGALVTRRGLLWAAAQADAKARGLSCDEYVADVGRAADAFVDSNELVDRAATVDALCKLAGADEGTLVLLVGAKDVGKSLIVRTLPDLLKPLRRRVVVLSARVTGADLARGIIKGIKPDATMFSEFVRQLTKMAPPIAAGLLSFAVNTARVALPRNLGVSAEAASAAASAAGASAASAFTVPSKDPDAYELEELVAVLEAYIAACATQGDFPVLVIDEANLALPSPRPRKAPGDTRPEPPLTPDEARERTRTLAALGLLTLLSKESKRLNVLLASSDHAEPYRLAELGYSIAHMTEVLVASEVPPAEMRAMLVDKWRCGPALAEGLLALYGGHVLRVKNALGHLARDKAGFKAISAFAPDAIRGALACLQAARGSGQSMEGLEGVLHELAERGFAVMPSRTDPRTVLVSHFNVGGVVFASTYAPGLPPAAWDEGNSVVLAASSQCMRLLLASELKPDTPSVSGSRASAP